MYNYKAVFGPHCGNHAHLSIVLYTSKWSPLRSRGARPTHAVPPVEWRVDLTDPLTIINKSKETADWLGRLVIMAS